MTGRQDDRRGQPLLIELSGAEADRLVLRRFYDTLYVGEFPDPNERESFENLEAYLLARDVAGAEYHIVLAIEDDRPIAGAITDYFVASRSGVVEFIVVAPDQRDRGLGSYLLRDAEERLHADAARRGVELGFVVAEINDPFRPGDTPDNVDPFERARWWGRRGYHRLDFPYVQPALSSEQAPVDNLMLCAKPTEQGHSPSLSVELGRVPRDVGVAGAPAGDRAGIARGLHGRRSHAPADRA
jgi:GNAT superfamily N-acetyltransferase